MRNLLITKAFLLASLVLPAVASAEAGTVAEARETVRQWFHGYEFVPEPHHYKRVGPHLAAALIGLALDDGEALFVRARALSAMVNTPGQATEPVLVAFAGADGVESLLRRKVVAVLVANHGAKHMDLVAGIYAGAVDDVPLREACARALAEMPGDGARALRDRLFRAEKSPTVRALLAPPKRLESTP
ncbi:MAG: hypothetical protein KC549_06055 [Myxococcales bacterium]|nr:hypothetical protein [Myxococcales bacterium]MCB9545666.1 hypothetical protein [Myxococcales bacterium]